MTEYRFYCIDDKNHIASRRELEAPDDLAALEKARALCGPHEVEVWAGARLVARLAKDGTGSLQPESPPRTP